MQVTRSGTEGFREMLKLRGTGELRVHSGFKASIAAVIFTGSALAA